MTPLDTGRGAIRRLPRLPTLADESALDWLAESMVNALLSTRCAERQQRTPRGGGMALPSS